MPRKTYPSLAEAEHTLKELLSPQRHAKAFLLESVQALVDGDRPVACALIRDAIRGSIGYGELSKRTGVYETSLVRMFGPNGNPTTANLCKVLALLQRKNGVRIEVQLVAVQASETRRAA